MLKINIDSEKVKIEQSGKRPERLADLITVYVSLACAVAQELNITPENALLNLYHLSNEYLTSQKEK